METSYARSDGRPRHIDRAFRRRLRRSRAANSWREPLRRLLGEISQYAVGTGALDGQQRLQRDRSLVYPAVSGRGHDHRIFAADLVDERGHAETLFDPPHDV